MAPPATVSVSLPKLARLLDHSLLHPALTDADLAAGFALALDRGLAAVCVPPYAVPAAVAALGGGGGGGGSGGDDGGSGGDGGGSGGDGGGSGGDGGGSGGEGSGGSHRPRVCAVVGFPHGTSTTSTKSVEAAEALRLGATEIDAVINIGKARSNDWAYVERELRALNQLVVAAGGLLKVIFENELLQLGRDEDEAAIARLCRICTDLRVGFVKTGTGYGFVRRADGAYVARGAAPAHLALMRRHAGPGVGVKAAGGVRDLDQLLRVVALGATRVGATASAAILDEAVARGIGEAEVEVEVPAW